MKLLVFCFLPVAISAIGFSQSVAVRGKLMCNDKPEKDVRIKLYEKGVCEFISSKIRKQ